MVSVCMATYNGEKYIEEQLESIRQQSLPPGEVILCDDHSADGTVEKITKFIAKYRLEGTWKLFCNESNKGYPGNFYRAMSLCRGDFVFLADQDDLWDLRKLEVMEEILRKREDVKALCCKFGLVDASDEKIHSLMAPARNHGTGDLRKVSIKDVFYKCEWPGMVLAYRGEWYKKKMEAVPGREIRGVPHDFLVCAWAAEQEGFFQLDEELAWHRRHESNVGGEEHRIARLLNRERKLQEVRDYNEILDAFAAENVLETEQGRETLAAKRRVMAERYEGLLSGTAIQILGNAFRNREWVRPATALCDAVIAATGGREKSGAENRADSK